MNLSWRAKMLRRGVLMGKLTDWRMVLREISHSHQPPKERPVLLETDDDLSLYVVDGRQIWLPTRFKPGVLSDISLEIFTDRIYDPGQGFLDTSGWVVDAGACEGMFALYALERGASVLAIEPVPDIARALRRTLASFILSGRVVVSECAIGDHPGTVNLQVTLDNPGCNSMALSREGGLTVPVEVETLDGLLQSLSLKASFLKADIEGAERLMLQGATRTFREQAPRLAICSYHMEDDWRVLSGIICKAQPRYRLWTNVFSCIYGSCDSQKISR